MSGVKGTKNKLFKGLTEHDILVWEEEKMRHQRRMGRKVTDVEFLRYLLMSSSRPVITAKDGVVSGFLTGTTPVYDKADTLLDKYRATRVRKGVGTKSSAKQNHGVHIQGASHEEVPRIDR